MKRKKQRPAPKPILPLAAAQSAPPAPPAREVLELDEVEQGLVAAHESEARRLEEQSRALVEQARNSRSYALAVIVRRRNLADAATRFQIEWSTEDGVPRLVLDRAARKEG